MALAAICVAAFALRVAVVVAWYGKVRLVSDPFHFYWQGRFVADGWGFLSPHVYFAQHHAHAPSAYHPPAFVVFLAFADILRLRSVQTQLILNGLLGTGSVCLLGLLGRRLWNPRAGIIAAALAAVYPNLWINDSMLLAETLFTLAVVVAVLLAYRIREQPTAAAVVSCSLASTVAGLARSEALLLLPLLVLPVIVGRTTLSWLARVRLLAMAAAAALVLVLPWLIYNAGRFDKPVLVSTNAGPTLAVGNCPLTYGGDLLGSWTPQCGLPPYLSPVRGDESVVDSHDRAVALEFMRHHVRALPKVVLAREGRMWGVYRVKQMVGLDALVEGRSANRGTAVLWWAEWMYGVLALLAIVGLVALSRARVARYPLLIPFVLAAFVAATTFGLTRYRSAADAMLVVLAAVGVDVALRRALRRRPARGEETAGSR